MADKAKNNQTGIDLLNEWTTRLGLKDWLVILFDNCNPEDMVLDNSDGCVSYEETTRAAKIQIVDPEKRQSGLRPFNYEETLVHELLHIKLCLLERGENWENKLQLRLLHQYIDDLARALVDAKINENK